MKNDPELSFDAANRAPRLVFGLARS